MRMKRTKLGVAGAAVAALAVGLTAQSAVAAAPDPPPFCAADTFTVGLNTPQSIPDNDTTGRTQTINVTGRTGTIRDLDLVTNVAHSFNRDISMTLSHQLPGGGATKTIAIVNPVAAGRTGSGGFAGTRWDDDAQIVVTQPEADLSTNGAKPTLVPEQALAAFIGDDPNGTWRLTVKDTSLNDTGTLSSWNLDFATSGAAAPTAVSSQDGPTGSVPDSHDLSNNQLVRQLTVSGAGTYLTDLDLNTQIEHTLDPSELEVRLTSPAGTTVLISRQRGSGSLRSLSTKWDDSSANLITTSTWNPGDTRPNVEPEASLGAFIGENPNGVWTLTITDTQAADGFQLQGWSINATSTNGCSAPAPNPNPPTPVPPANPPVCVRTNLVATILGQKKAIRGKVAAVKIRVRNATAGASAGDTTAKFTLPAGFTLSSKPRTATLKKGVLTLRLGTIAGGKSKTVTVGLKAKTGAALGVKRRTVSVRANCGSADTAKLAVTVARAPR